MRSDTSTASTLKGQHGSIRDPISILTPLAGNCSLLPGSARAGTVTALPAITYGVAINQMYIFRGDRGEGDTSAIKIK